jgi:hypothetical protein
MSPPRKSSRTARDFLRAGLGRGQPLPLLDERDWGTVVERARDHGLLAQLHGLPEMRRAPDEVRAVIREAARHVLTDQMRIEADLRVLAEALDSVGATWAVVKGPVLSEYWYAVAGQRMFLDLDVVVHPAHFGRALEALQAAGALLVDRNFTHALRQKRAELSLLLPWGTALDLHWHLLNTPELRDELPLSVAEILGRRIWVSVGALRIPTFGATDTLFHLCLHTVLSGGQKLLWYRDIEQVAASRGVDWEALARRASAARASLLVAVALQRARHLAAAPVPPGFERRVSRGGALWRSSIKLLDVIRPLGGPTGRPLSGRLAVKASRHDTRTSLRALVRLVVHELTAQLVHDRNHPWRRFRKVTAPPSPPNPLWGPAEDPEDEWRYLVYVASQAT